jgi:UDP-N-acetylmuramate-alanine ligase
VKTTADTPATAWRTRRLPARRWYAARQSGSLVLRRAGAPEARRCVAVAGTHGRPRPPCLPAVALQACGLDPSVASGVLVE